MIKILRPVNLLFLAIIQILLYSNIMTPILLKYGLSPLTPIWQLLLVILGSALICGGGYIINDYFDTKIDRINRPNSMIIGSALSKKSAMRYYQIVTSIGLLCGLIPAIWTQNFTLGFIFVVTPGMLWFYSASYKRQFLIGNLIVALSSALSLMLPLLLESKAQEAYYGDIIRETPVIAELYLWIMGFALFAFIWTFIREIIKDVEDIAGDRENECRTLPIKWGVKNTRYLLSICILLVNGALFYISKYNISFPLQSQLSNIYYRYLIGIPSVVLIFLLFMKSSKNWHYASTLTKVIMLLGILYSFTFYYLMATNFDILVFGIFSIAN